MSDFVKELRSDTFMRLLTHTKNKEIKVIKYLILVALTSVFSCSSVLGVEYKAGSVVPKVKCGNKGKWSYVLYLPNNYDHSRKESWPVMFVMLPGGGNAQAVNKYKNGANLIGAILAISVESKNYFNQSEAAVEGMVDDVFDKFNINSKFVFTSGFSGGARMAFWASGKLKGGRLVTGVLPCGGGDTDGTIGTKAWYYGVCGSNCFNRWDMTITFQNRLKRNGKLNFIPGGHTWGNVDQLTQGMAWLYAQCMNKSRPGKSEYDAYVGRFTDELKTVIDATGDLYLKFEYSSILANLKAYKESSSAKAALKKLSGTKEIKTYVSVQKDIEKFAKKHFNTSVMDYENNPTTNKAKSDSKRLQKKYADTPFVALFTKFGEPCVRAGGKKKK